MTQPLSPSSPAHLAVEAALRDACTVDLSWIQPPPAKGWTLAADALRFLTSLVQHAQPRHILEFGSGLSTRVLARACDCWSPSCIISSVDHDPEYGRLAATEFARLDGPTGRVAFQIAPVIARDCGGKNLPVYALEPARFANPAPADLLLIDGPPSELGGREGTLYQAMEFLRPGALALLDDADRVGERAIVQRWQENLGDGIEVRRLPGFSRGLVAIVVHKPVRRAELLAHRQQLTRQEIEELVLPEETFLLVDLNYWGPALVPHRRSLPFLEQDGQYWGSPADDAIAIRELERMRGAGATHLIFTWPAFWWFECYPELLRHIRTQYPCLRQNDRLVAFDLRGH